MSDWTYFTGYAVFENEHDFDDVFGKGCDPYERDWRDFLTEEEYFEWAVAACDDWEYCCEHPDEYMPAGSEGTLKKCVGKVDDGYSVDVYGSLRDVSEVEPLANWFKDACAKTGDLLFAKYHIRESWFGKTDEGEIRRKACALAFEGRIMGYYSNVRISTTKDGYEFMKNELKENKMMDGWGFVEEVNEPDGVVFGWDCVKWYKGDFPEVDEVMDVLYFADEKGFPWLYVEVGEDGHTETIDSGNEPYYNLTYFIEASTVINVYQ